MRPREISTQDVVDFLHSSRSVRTLTAREAAEERYDTLTPRSLAREAQIDSILAMEEGMVEEEGSSNEASPHGESEAQRGTPAAALLNSVGAPSFDGVVISPRTPRRNGTAEELAPPQAEPLAVPPPVSLSLDLGAIRNPRAGPTLAAASAPPADLAHAAGIERGLNLEAAKARPLVAPPEPTRAHSAAHAAEPDEAASWSCSKVFPRSSEGMKPPALRPADSPERPSADAYRNPSCDLLNTVPVIVPFFETCSSAHAAASPGPALGAPSGGAAQRFPAPLRDSRSSRDRASARSTAKDAVARV